ARSCVGPARLRPLCCQSHSRISLLRPTCPGRKRPEPIAMAADLAEAAPLVIGPASQIPAFKRYFRTDGPASGTEKSSNDLLTLPEVRTESGEHFQHVATCYRLKFPDRFTECQ